MTDRRLIEVAFPLEQTSLDSVHEKNVRHGHISTLHIWPARRPLAACRAALIATLLPDPGTPEKRRELCERIGGKVEKVIEKKKGPGARGEEKIVRKTVGGILHWGRETENKADLEFFRQEIRKAFGGRAPRVLDPFAGGGAIPLEAMRLGCEVTAIDINPVAWFILKCTLEYPQKLAGQKRPLPDFVRSDAAFMESFFKAQGFKGAMLRTQLRKLGLTESGTNRSQQGSLKDSQTGKELDLTIEEHTLEADLAWHVRAWGWWVLREARRELARYYPVYADFQPIKDVENWLQRHRDQARQMQLVPTSEDGTPDVDLLNTEFNAAYLSDQRNPRWVAKPTVAYLWARTVNCKNCRGTIPLLKTRWLAKRHTQRVLLVMEPNAGGTSVTFSARSNVPAAGGNNAQKREHDRRLGQGTMNRSGAWCPLCGRAGTVAMEMSDLRAEGRAGRLGAIMTAVAVDGPDGKEFRVPTELERSLANLEDSQVDAALGRLPHGPLEEPTPSGGGTGAGRAFSVQPYGLMRWQDLFTRRQLVSLSTLLEVLPRAANNIGETLGIEWKEALGAYLLCGFDRLLDFANQGVQWKIDVPTINHSFVRFALPITWDYAEGNVIGDSAGSYKLCLDRIASGLDTFVSSQVISKPPDIRCVSAKQLDAAEMDVVITDPPYYDAIPYSDLMDFFYIWLRRGVHGIGGLRDKFTRPLSPKWDVDQNDGELIDDSSRHGGDSTRSKQVYEQGMADAFRVSGLALKDSGRLVVVFANKQPDAWETLVSALIGAGFVVDGSWPIQTEQASRMRALASAALASSVWLVARKRPAAARAGWDNIVLQEMRTNIGEKLREFWDAGIRGPDFVWAATGPALEAYSKYPVVKKANQPGETMSVSEFLRAVRRLVVEFIVGRVLGELTHSETTENVEGATGLDDVTTYYLLHRHDFGMNDAPAGACILYALSCNLAEGELADRYAVLLRSGGVDQDDDGEPDEGDADAEGDVTEGSGATFKLRPWKQRRRPGLGAATVDGSTTVPLVDMAHHLMHLWVDGDVHKVNAYTDERGLRRNEMFRHVLQALIELAEENSDERSVLERISNHLQARGQAPASLRDVGLGVATADNQE